MNSAAIRGWAAYYLPPLLWAALIYFGSSFSSLGSMPSFLPPHADKIAHFFEFAVLALLTARALYHADAGRFRASCAIAAALVALYGASDELHQLFVPGRSSDIFDWMTDIAGAVAGSLAYYRFFRPGRSQS